jgi:hypothetical protein
MIKVNNVKDNAKRISRFNLNKINDMSHWVLRFDNDPLYINRVKAQTCKYCYYKPSVVSLQAFTEFKCIVCNETFMHHNSDVDHVCKSCATEHELCVHCGGEIN